MTLVLHGRTARGRRDVEPAIRCAHDAGPQVITLTNGPAQTTTALLRRAGIAHYVERQIEHAGKPLHTAEILAAQAR